MNKNEPTLNEHKKHERNEILISNKKEEEQKETKLAEASNDWKLFFLQWREENREQGELTVELLTWQNQTLYEQNCALEQKIDFLVKETELLKKSREELEQRRQQRKEAKKKLLRDSITYEEFQSILELTKDLSYSSARSRISFLLLYYTGLRVSNLLKLKKVHYQQLLEQLETNIELIKNGPKRHLLHIGREGQKALLENSHYAAILIEDKSLEDYLITAAPKKVDKFQSLNRATLDRQLNKILTKASTKLGKHLRTHSFRATFVTDCLNSGVPIHEVQEMVGHSDIKSTAIYKRSRLTTKQRRRIISSVNKTRKENKSNLVQNKKESDKKNKEKASKQQ